jgi:DNA-binding transcriptional LysR family regulator
LATSASGELGARAQVSWREAAALRLCLLSDDMQNRRILNSVFGMHALDVCPDVSSNSFLGILSHLETGAWSSIVPHTFAHLLARRQDIVFIPLVEPAHTQLIGLVTSDREPPPPMARALETIARSLDLDAALGEVS